MKKSQPVTKPRLDWRGSDLRQMILAGLDLEGADLRGCDLRGANLSGVNLRYADLRGTMADDANFQNACLYGAKMQGIDARRADFRGADMRQANLAGAYIEGAMLAHLNTVTSRLFPVNDGVSNPLGPTSMEQLDAQAQQMVKDIAARQKDEPEQSQGMGL